MKKVFKIFAFIFAIFILTESSVLPVFAMEMENEGLEVVVKYDKEVYEEGKPITASIIVRNISGEDIIITGVEQLVPEGYKLSEDIPRSEGDIILEPDGKIELKVTYGEELLDSEGDEAQKFFDKVIFGESFGIPNILIAVILIIAVALFYYFT